MKIIKTKFKIGDREIFIVNKINDTNPITYKLKDLNDEEIIGSFYEYELKKTAL